MIYQSRSQEDLAPKIPHQNVANALGEIAHVWGQLEEIEEKHQVQTQKAPDLGFCYIAYRWANGNSLNNVLKGSDMSVGDFVRSTKQLIDLMNQIAAASEKLRPTCREAYYSLRYISTEHPRAGENPVGCIRSNEWELWQALDSSRGRCIHLESYRNRGRPGVSID
jgi:hypothetical protein